jgi:hypothetical protein
MLNRTNVGLWLGMTLITLSAAGCGDVLGPELDEHEAARALWTLTNADDYLFEFRRSCFCGSDFVRLVRIEVLDGVVSSAVYVDTEEPIAEPLSSAPTIEDLFDEIRDALDGTAFSVTADYDADMGYPIRVSIDYIENAIDDEMAFDVSLFQLLDP